VSHQKQQHRGVELLEHKTRSRREGGDHIEALRTTGNICRTSEKNIKKLENTLEIQKIV
jgi:hypothetical protein